MAEAGENKLTCTWHPDRETYLRCNRCERPMCPACAVQTPTGYRCKECVRGQQKVFETAITQDYLFSIAIALILSYLGSLLATRIGFFVIFLAPFTGGIIAEAVRKVINKRRSKKLFQAVTGAAIAGALIQAFPLILGLFIGSENLFGIIWASVYILLMVSALNYRLSGIQIR
jgi:MFS family permease